LEGRQGMQVEAAAETEEIVKVEDSEETE